MTLSAPQQGIPLYFLYASSQSNTSQILSQLENLFTLLLWSYQKTQLLCSLVGRKLLAYKFELLIFFKYTINMKKNKLYRQEFTHLSFVHWAHFQDQVILNKLVPV